jgi:hypothetical protein
MKTSNGNLKGRSVDFHKVLSRLGAVIGLLITFAGFAVQGSIIQKSYAAWVASDSNAGTITTASSFQETFTWSTCGGPYTQAVSSGYTTASVTVEGAQGGNPGTDGEGATMVAKFSVDSSDTLNVYVGCQGASESTTGSTGYGGGGGGGAESSGGANGDAGGGGSAVCVKTCSTSSLEVVAGGGGGDTPAGGWGSAEAGGTGNSGSTGSTSTPSGTAYLGVAGAGSSAGSAGGSSGTPPGNGAAGSAGGCCVDSGGGGGGGGYAGGGGGGGGEFGGLASAGGSGSSWAATGVTVTSYNGTNSGAGYVSITLS